VIRRALRAVLCVVALLVAWPSVAHAEPGDELTISVLTFGPGDHPFFKFGHNAILVHDVSRNDSRRDMVYNFGTFGFESWTLIPNFFQGKLQYWLSIQSLAGTIALYREENRTIIEQELELTPKQRREIADSLWANALPANKYYKYDYYQDNCSTRVRDAVDKVIGGRIKAASTPPAGMSWRSHTRRLTADDLPVYLGLHAAMGSFIDQKITVWEEMFLPVIVQDTLRKVTVVGPDGAEKPLVKRERQILDAPGRPPLRTAPPGWSLRMFIAGSAIGGIFYALFQSQQRKPARIVLGVLLAFFGLVLGFLGCLFCAFWFFTDHQVAYHNENILQSAPWLLGLVAAGVQLARGKPSGARVRLLLVAAAGASVLGLVCKVLPWFRQDNAEIIALMLPIWVGAAAGAEVARRKAVANLLPG
jgi:hypothetical protein